MQDPTVSTQPDRDDLSTFSSHWQTTITPAYPAVYEQVNAPSSIFWWSIVKKPQIGEAVVQLGTRSPSHPFAFGRAQGGFRAIYRARATGPHDLTIHVVPGPITRKQGARVAAVAWVQGVGGTFRAVNVHSYHPTKIEIRDAYLRFGYVYQIVVAGEVVNVAPTGSQPYGEFIGSFPYITIEPPYAAATAEEQDERAGFAELLEAHDDLEAMCGALSAGADCHASVIQLTDEQLASAEAWVSETSNRDD